jgi:hypothetical protein
MGKGIGVSLAVLALGGLLAVGATARSTTSGVPAPAAFRLADGSAGCAFDGRKLTCSGATSSPSVVLDDGGRTRAARGRVDWNASTPVLRWTEGWFNGVFSCRVADRTIVCTTTDGGLLAVDG